MPNTKEESYTLENFLTILGKILDDIYSARNILFRKTFREELEQTNSKKEWKKKIDDLKNYLDSPTSNQTKELQNVGLEGKMLKLKLLGFLENYEEYDKKGGIERLKRLIKYAKMILGSLSKVFPYAEFLKELLEAIEMGIEESEKNNL